MVEIYAHEHPKEIQKASIFLAGPSPRGSEDYNWRPKALEYLSKKQFPGVVFIPLPRDGNWLPNYDAQVEWELKYLDESKAIAFWIPRDLVNLPAFTTNVEFGMFLKSGKIVLGYPKNAVKMKYLHRVAEINNVPISHTLGGTLDATITLALKRTNP